VDVADRPSKSTEHFIIRRVRNQIASGSFIAVSYLGDGKLGEMFCRRGLIANRGSSALHNNLAVALAIQGRIEEAKKELGNIKSYLSITEQVVNFATQGLIQMRSGNVGEGGRLYQKARQGATSLIEV
jgi:hypothetical protein